MTLRILLPATAMAMIAIPTIASATTARAVPKHAHHAKATTVAKSSAVKKAH
ncbi:hypothetical protein [Sphingomonas alpina]|uniref:Acid-shock protein n=1 Tax=Sphingomonas alpina TaxID=653931 RepID=A0A7H0LE42_9SPHN|nr:hypothetical protein [Sphingomonas alpina]QNQ07945.1 hypothetical protein H3Z74_14235 [Sphingomonas alpina]